MELCYPYWNYCGSGECGDGELHLLPGLGFSHHSEYFGHGDMLPLALWPGQGRQEQPVAKMPQGCAMAQCPQQLRRGDVSQGGCSWIVVQAGGYLCQQEPRWCLQTLLNCSQRALSKVWSKVCSSRACGRGALEVGVGA